MAGEAFAWPEGQIVFFTGAASPVTSAVVAYAQNSNINLQRQWDNRPSISGVYRDHLVGLNARVGVGAVYAFDGTLERIHESATAVHAKFIHSGVNGTAGYLFFSGRIDSMSFRGSQGAPYTWALNYHANVWSAF